MGFKEIVKEALQEQKMTQKELAEKLEISNAAVSRWFSGESKPNLLNIQKISKILRIDESKIKTSLDFNNSEQEEKKAFIASINNIETVEDAARWVENLFLDFEIDNNEQVTTKFMLKCYTMMAVLQSLLDYHHDVAFYEAFIERGKLDKNLVKYRSIITKLDELYLKEYREEMYEHIRNKYDGTYDETNESEIGTYIASISETFYEVYYDRMKKQQSNYKFIIYTKLLIEHIEKKAELHYSLKNKYDITRGEGVIEDDES